MIYNIKHKYVSIQIQTHVFWFINSDIQTNNFSLKNNTYTHTV